MNWARSHKLTLTVIALIVAFFAFKVVDANPTCDTDEQCAATWQCRIKSTCDGGPVNGPWVPPWH